MLKLIIKFCLKKWRVHFKLFLRQLTITLLNFNFMTKNQSAKLEYFKQQYLTDNEWHEKTNMTIIRDRVIIALGTILQSPLWKSEEPRNVTYQKTILLEKSPFLIQNKYQNKSCTHHDGVERGNEFGSDIGSQWTKFALLFAVFQPKGRN